MIVHPHKEKAGVYFRHRLEDVADWRNMQQRVLDQIASFEIREWRCSPTAMMSGRRDLPHLLNAARVPPARTIPLRAIWPCRGLVTHA
ncbi:hypothetical protein AYJ54_01025 [Bradyrhizobium centrolobii]|uniref:Uncharacterized protein n=1 Tax=Bradyrhizobium centrolobii TaxID=1505087 RepID=A0A176YFX2_9BRAD|nr:hypothetical protein AYJ54_01025 [Bradyrhizobium centrolobii]